jgi:hypothetical protein
MNRAIRLFLMGSSRKRSVAAVLVSEALGSSRAYVQRTPGYVYRGCAKAEVREGHALAFCIKPHSEVLTRHPTETGKR